MKLSRKKPHRLLLGLGVALLMGASCLFAGCSDTVDESNLYSFSGETLTSHLANTPEYSDFSYLLTRVRLSDRSMSTVSDMLSARGNYTCFAPTNDAVQHYLDSIYSTPGYDVYSTPDSTAEFIVRNCIIDNGDEPAYLSTDFVSTSLEKKTMDDRYITLSYETDDNKPITIINAMARLVVQDIELENGVLHGVDHVISPSTAFLPTLIQQTEDLHIFSKLLEVTGWADSLLQFRDVEYEKQQPILVTKTDVSGTIAAPSKRNQGYTAFVESDRLFFEKGWISEMPDVVDGEIRNWDKLLQDIIDKLNEKRSADVSAYGEYEGILANTGSRLKDPDNIVNQFVSYHLLPEALTYDKIVIHYVELGYAWNTPSVKSINCHEYYETMSRDEQKWRRILKFTDGATTDGIRINRYVAKYDTETYQELSVGAPGIQVKTPDANTHNDALNGFFYYLDDVLYYDGAVPFKVLNERMRYDICALFPEFITNGIRRPSQAESKYVYIPHGYVGRMTMAADTKYFYGPQFMGYNYQSDEHNIQGSYDLVFKLPPVPYNGTYELRWCVSTNPNRGMCQVYLGTDKNNLTAIGLPLDMRLDPSDPSIGWAADDPEDETINAEIDKRMRLHDYMKPPMHDGAAAGGGRVTSPMRAQTAYQRVRKILWRGTVKANEVLYVRLKTVLENVNTMLVLDFMEWCPKSVYNSMENPEDRW